MSTQTKRSDTMKNVILNKEIHTVSAGILAKDSFVQVIEPGAERSKIRIDNKELYVSNSDLSETNRV